MKIKFRVIGQDYMGEWILFESDDYDSSEEFCNKCTKRMVLWIKKVWVP